MVRGDSSSFGMDDNVHRLADVRIAYVVNGRSEFMVFAWTWLVQGLEAILKITQSSCMESRALIPMCDA